MGNPEMVVKYETNHCVNGGLNPRVERNKSQDQFSCGFYSGSGSANPSTNLYRVGAFTQDRDHRCLFPTFFWRGLSLKGRYRQQGAVFSMAHWVWEEVFSQTRSKVPAIQGVCLTFVGRHRLTPRKRICDFSIVTWILVCLESALPLESHPR